jgi:hypothetical protein
LGEQEPTPQSELVPRVGTYLFLLGIFALIFFLASDFADRPAFDWLFVGMVLMGFGILLRRRAAPTPSAGRFGTIRRMREETKKRKEEREKKAKRNK